MYIQTLQIFTRSKVFITELMLIDNVINDTNNQVFPMQFAYVTKLTLDDTFLKLVCNRYYNYWKDLFDQVPLCKKLTYYGKSLKNLNTKSDLFSHQLRLLVKLHETRNTNLEKFTEIRDMAKSKQLILILPI